MAKKNRSNPFDPTKPAIETFVGRANLLKELVCGLRDGNSYELIGPVGIGKTSFQLKVQSLILADRACRTISQATLPVYVECLRKHDHEGLLFSKIVKELMECLLQCCGRVCPLKVQREAEMAAEEGRLRDALETALRWAFEEMKRSFRVILFLDALHRISEKAVLSSLMGALNNEVDRKSVNVLLSGRHPIRQSVPGVSDLRFLIDRRILEPLSECETAALLAIAERLGWTVDKGSVEMIYQITHGHPYRLQYYMHKSLVIDRKITPISLQGIQTPETEKFIEDNLIEKTKTGDIIESNNDSEPRKREIMNLLADVGSFSMSRHIVAGKYVRYDTEDVQLLKREAVRIMNACTTPSSNQENFFVWGYPGEGKTFFVSELANEVGVPYIEINLNDSGKVPDGTTLRSLLSSAVAGENGVLCCLDEVDKRPDASEWLYSSIFTFLDNNKNKPRANSPNKVFVLIGSKQPDFASFKEEILKRKSGGDLIRRVTHPEIEIPRLKVGDLMVTVLSMIWASRPENDLKKKKIVSVSSLALAYLLLKNTSNGSIAGATEKALAHMKDHETSFTADHLQLTLDEWKTFDDQYPSANSSLLNKYVHLHP